MKSTKPTSSLLIIASGIILIGLVWILWRHEGFSLRSKGVTPAVAQSPQPSPPASITYTNAVFFDQPPPPAAPAPQPAFVSQTTLLHQPPSVFEFQLRSGEDVAAKTSSVRGVALSKDGKVLTLASFFDGTTRVISTSSAGSSVPSYGWMARDSAGPWIILQTGPQVSTPAQVVAASALAFKEGDLLAIPTPTPETPNAAQTILAIKSPEGTPIKPQDEIFWVTGPSEVLNLGAPVLDSAGHLVGLVDQKGVSSNQARVHKISSPLPVMDAAVEQEKPLDWTLTAPPASTINLQPYSDPSITQETIQHLAELTGAPLTGALDDFLKQHSSSPLAWYVASMGYARAGKLDHAIVSAQMLTKVAPHQWQGWYLYGRQLEANQQFGQAADAYQQAAEAEAPQSIIGIPLGVALFKSGNYRLGLDNLKNLVSMRPNFYDGWLALGDMQRAQSLLAEATHSYTHVLMLNPQSIPNWEILASIYDQLQNPEGSVQCYVQLTLLKPDNPDIWYNMGLALLKANLPDAARPCFEKTLALRSNDAGAIRLLARLDGAPAHAQQLLEKIRHDLAQLPPDHAINYASIKDSPIDGTWQNHDLRLTFRYGNVHFRDRVDGTERSFPSAGADPVLGQDSAFVTLTVAPVRQSPSLYTHRFELAPYIPGFALYIYYKDGTGPSVAGKQSVPSGSERNFYRLIEQDLSQLPTLLTSN